ncbi:hypothetical protein D3C85_1845460 [compost metagenome]
MQADAVRGQCGGHLLVAAAFIDAVFLVDPHCVQVELVAQAPDQLRCRCPGVDVADQQRHVQLAQGLG